MKHPLNSEEIISIIELLDNQTGTHHDLQKNAHDVRSHNETSHHSFADPSVLDKDATLFYEHFRALNKKNRNHVQQNEQTFRLINNRT